MITGSTALTEGAVLPGNTVFTVSVAADGTVTLTQVQQIDHPIHETAPAYNDDVVSLASGLIGLTATATITDKDGDSASDSETVDLGGNLKFDDDGPNAVDDIKSAGTSGSITGNVLTDGPIDDSFGADGKGSPAITQVVFKGTTFTDNSDGTPDGLIHVQGDFGKLELDTATGAYTYTRTSGINDTGTDTFSYTIKDGDGDTDTADLKIAIDAANILNGVFITNTNSTDQPLVLTFQQVTNPIHFSAKIYSLNAQGQQGTVLQDVGFFIDPTLKFNYSVEAGETTNFTNINVTDFSLEGTDLNAPGGSDNWAIRYDDDGPGSRDTAFSGVFQPSTKAEIETDQPSVDGDKDPNTLNDPNAGGAGLDFEFGAAGNDVLNGSDTDPDILNGGNGSDQLLGKGGNDILVYDAADVSPVGSVGIVDGGAGADVLRIDDGALAIFFGTANNVVDLRGADIHNIEVIGITEEAVSDKNNGTTIKLTAADVLAFADDTVGADGIAANTIYVVGSQGDKVQLASNGAGFVDGDVGTAGIQPTGTFDDGQGQVFNIYTITGGGALYVDKDITVQTVA